MPNTRQRTSSSKLLSGNGSKQNGGSALAKQVTFDVLLCNVSDSNRRHYHNSESSCNLMVGDVRNLSLDDKHGLEISGKSVMPEVSVVGVELPKMELSCFDGQ
ncbi:unnamed protein product [Schistosoma margrebowiei]|uniref:Uncharacterized protein n=1 Tax=Schistosoma margrebowiei TaxID=48269 RepID=A0A183MXV8_9TREM|nr:unnamed protein product [Schistosoma margrebowiei]